ncbi:hypothetical protein Bbelb_054020 [Branchiostoma belcheri]|nr:hypothetical protein Bbelb_054020 [Branchiostoma belcheri]
MRCLLALVVTLEVTLVTSTSPKQRTRQPLRGHHFTCQDLPNGNYPDLEDCTKFYMCSHGLASSFSCPGSQLFDIKTLRCEWPEHATCAGTSVKGKTRTDPQISAKKISGSDKCSSWTDWFNRDTPTRTGDWEDLIGLRRDYPGQICEKPTDIQARVVGSGLDASLTGDIYHFYDTTKGFVCRMGDQGDGTCQDYEVRFCCPNKNVGDVAF